MKKILSLFSLLLFITTLNAQSIDRADVDPFDYGKMWTFENPPKEWFKEAYNFEPSDKWFDDVRKSSLKFASWCSASFVSPNGLIMTNHHCSRDAVTAVQHDGENFDTEGFYAKTLTDERRAEELFVEQLVKVEDISEQVFASSKNVTDEAEKESLIASSLERIQSEYASKPDWQGLRLEVVSYYSGGKYSLYGHKKYDDIRLVWIPELDLGIFGGDPDNFTYPRYNLDCTFWRAYDDNGQPLNTSDNYFKFNKNGASEGEPVFVIGNPGSTERYRTVAQLEYDRDYRYPVLLRFLSNRHKIMIEEHKELVKDPTKVYEAQELLSTAFGLSNSIKAIGGALKGLKNPDLFGRKITMENFIRSKSPDVNYWDQLADEYDKLYEHSWAVNHLSPSGLRGDILLLLFTDKSLRDALSAEERDEAEIGEMKEEVKRLAKSLNDPKEISLFKLLLSEIKTDIYKGDKTLRKALDGKSIDGFMADLLDDTRFKKEKKLNKLLKKEKRYKKGKDDLQELGDLFVNRFYEAVTAFRSSTPFRKNLEAKIANQTFKVFGTSLPPDATFTLRISDGIVKGYKYNGTEAPYKTTYFGMYDRYESNDQRSPWALPDRWKNPSLELLKSPINFVSTNDIIGGNSGSPMINKNREVVGLIFDGNIESLPGKFIYDVEFNRTVSVHAGGMIAAMKYIYNADRLVKELLID